MKLAIEKKIDKLNAVISEWKQQFEKEVDIELSFSCAGNGMLTLDCINLCPMCDVDVDTADYDMDVIFFYAADDLYEITIGMPYASEPFLEAVTKTSVLYQVS